ncbi:tRNA (N6-isopentenyl adenosine(37)-C2)-methylthiotransferase MiaB [Candidatus Liberibacter africanus]|uniref:tRNA-2-methylthio-N(6)-dimethylallyladenosine synthase n=1 Tax=Candidatus Liberibacter africanus PTSAPSY TaxID=1277257 RepID=A0A0G3I8Y7_LIBAF|nr:tRNA (N6-isopentenyl adenosine(37)-C2)-methylthiotransferase MiaB [Candidatus Liberibacter africanus]AKK20227.1 2-methylthioadenine synthetase (miaB-like) protein [Candidatus Liberibacter africanus PTSAPSY]QTP64004.1 tRNA (N6-isopentenyl adenosine(37)-C2)-methylthiotransferase MiaB [Candidatus Liberibacter africanus]
MVLQVVNQGVSPQKFFVKNYGCQMNVYDSLRIEDIFFSKGYEKADCIDDANLIVLNTCHIRERAAEKVYSSLGRIRNLKASQTKEGRDTIVIVAGCVAQAEGEEILRRSPVVNVVVGPQKYYRLPELLEHARLGKRVVDTDYSIEDKFERLSVVDGGYQRKRGVAAFLTIQEGCDKFCTFCVVPYTRGAEISRSLSQVVDEARKLVDNGVREITLLGQNVNAWRGKGLNGQRCAFSDLLYSLSDIKGLIRLRYTTSHPRDMSDCLIKAHGDLDILMPYLHLPVQSGSDRILKSMNRRHTVDEYRQIIDRIRSIRAKIAISSDFIVGFPGETDDDFAATMDLVDEIGYSQAYSFKYSPRPGTPGSNMLGQIEENIKTERLLCLQEKLREQQVSFNNACVGQIVEVLIEKKGREKGQLVGRSPWLQSVVFDSRNHKIGDVIKVRITDVKISTLYGELLVKD